MVLGFGLFFFFFGCLLAFHLSIVTSLHLYLCVSFKNFPILNFFLSNIDDDDDEWDPKIVLWYIQIQT